MSPTSYQLLYPAMHTARSDGKKNYITLCRRCQAYSPFKIPIRNSEGAVQQNRQPAALLSGRRLPKARLERIWETAGTDRTGSIGRFVQFCAVSP